MIPRPASFRLLILSLATVVAAAATLAVPSTAYASRYRVDLIVFTDNANAGSEQAVPALLPDHGQAISIGDTSALAAHGIQVLSQSDSDLGKAWAALRYSRDFHPVMQISWIQTRAASGTAIRIQHGAPLSLAGLSVPPIVGRIALRTGRLLHLEAHMRYNFVNTSGAVVSYKLNETRRVRFKELHYIDSPKLGILARVTKVK